MDFGLPFGASPTTTFEPAALATTTMRSPSWRTFDSLKASVDSDTQVFFSEL